MSMKGIKDEYGVIFCVLPRDPASKYINTLHRKGYQYIVLPRQTLISGLVSGAQSEDYIDNIRMQDCLKELGLE